MHGRSAAAIKSGLAWDYAPPAASVGGRFMVEKSSHSATVHFRMCFWSCTRYLYVFLSAAAASMRPC